MAERERGYGKPPKGRPFPPGTSGNLTGRPKFTPDKLAEVVHEVVESPVQYRENGHAKTTTRRELRLMLRVAKAVKGDVHAAEMLLKERRRALRLGEAGPQRLLITNWLPDFPGQTAEQKTLDAMGPDRRNRGSRKPTGRDQDPRSDDLPPANEGG